ncbi:MAG: SpoIID/LytB domain-containing protein [Nitrospira sp.]|nr:SpoIID/LytB domain-containing protein [Nitrospira sp.]MDD9860596.1 SpoIID/LytB domain-containing protein [Nitrospira sp.]
MILIPLLLVSMGLGPLLMPVYAADHVRVALAEKATRVTVTSVGGLRLRFAGTMEGGLDQGVAVSSGVTVVRNGGAMQVDGERVRGDWVTLRGHSGALTVTLHDTKSDTHQWVVKGDVKISKRDAHLLVVNRVDLEEYVAGVVSAEVNPRWHEELLKTQAVAARTYVLYKTLVNAHHPFDVHASVRDQVYKGLQHVNDAVRRAVAATRGEVVTHKGRPIFAVYSSTAAGPTEDAMNVWSQDLPYLKGVECPFDQDAPRYRWQAAIPFERVESRFREAGYPIGWLATITPYSMTKAGRVNKVRILHSKGVLMVTGQELRRVLGFATVWSTRFHIERIGRDVVFAGHGAGHGVGLCQWGARAMAGLGYRYRSILHYYYPGTEILPLSRVIMSLTS